jgi:hypothetical protein
VICRDSAATAASILPIVPIFPWTARIDKLQQPPDPVKLLNNVLQVQRSTGPWAVAGACTYPVRRQNKRMHAKRHSTIIYAKPEKVSDSSILAQKIFALDRPPTDFSLKPTTSCLSTLQTSPLLKHILKSWRTKFTKVPSALIWVPPTAVSLSMRVSLTTSAVLVARAQIPALGTQVDIIANEQGSFTTPSFVSFTDEERLIGEAAKNQAAMNPANTVFDIK